MKLKMPDGRLIEATPMKFEVVKEDWNEYKLDDGTIIKLKTSAIKIFRLETTDPVTGEHHYYVQHHTVVTAFEPKE